MADAQDAKESVPTTCLACYKLWDETFVQLACSAIICKTCIPNWGKTNCPWCRCANGLSDAHRVQGPILSQLTAIRGQVVVSCPNELCTDTMLLQDVKTHLTKICPYSMTKCPKCDKELFRNDLTLHQSRECPQRLVACEDCKIQVVHNNLEEHRRTQCPECIVACQWCTQDMLRKQVRSHTQECDLVPVECSHRRCIARPSRRDRNAHEKECMYRMAMCDSCKMKLQFVGLQNHKKTCPTSTVWCKNGCSKAVPRQYLFQHVHQQCSAAVDWCKAEGCFHFWKRYPPRKLHLNVHACPTAFDEESVHKRLQRGMLLDMRLPRGGSGWNACWKTVLFLDVQRTKETEQIDCVFVLVCVDPKRFLAEPVWINRHQDTLKLQLAPAWSMNRLPTHVSVSLGALSLPREYSGSVFFAPGELPLVVGDTSPTSNYLDSYALLGQHPHKNAIHFEVGGMRADVVGGEHKAAAPFALCHVDFQLLETVWVTLAQKTYALPRSSLHNLEVLRTQDIQVGEYYVLEKKQPIAGSNAIKPLLEVKLLGVRFEEDEKSGLQCILTCTKIETFADTLTTMNSFDIPYHTVSLYPWNIVSVGIDAHRVA